jgi:hypothetical protein
MTMITNSSSVPIRTKATANADVHKVLERATKALAHDFGKGLQHGTLLTVGHHLGQRIADHMAEFAEGEVDHQELDEGEMPDEGRTSALRNGLPVKGSQSQKEAGQLLCVQGVEKADMETGIL